MLALIKVLLDRDMQREPYLTMMGLSYESFCALPDTHNNV